MEYQLPRGKNNLLVSFINLNVITCNMKKKKIETKWNYQKWQKDKLYPYLWRFTTSVYDSTFGKVHHTMIQVYYAVKWEKKSSVCTVLHSLHFNMTDFHEASGPLHDNCTKSSQVKKNLNNKTTIKMVESVMYSILRGRSWQVGIHTNLALFCPWREC